jgi:hypothetical protein
MQRAWLLIVALAACSPGGRQIVDAKVDGPVDASHDAAGSGSDVASASEPSPHDYGLELTVLATSMAVVVVPVRASRRRRQDDDDATRRT